MQLYQPTITGSLAVSGSVIVNGSITVSNGLLSGTASLATTASFAVVANSASYAASASNALSAQSASYILNAVSSSYILNAQSASIATTALTASSADNFLVRNTLTAQTLVVQTITSSVSTITGSTNFGSTGSNTHSFTGSMSITGSLAVVTTGTELQVNATGVNLGNALTDSHVISGSLRVNPNGLFVSGSGRVGIGTTNPTQLLHLSSSSTSATGIQLTLGSEVRDHYLVSTTPNTAAGRDLGLLAWRSLTLKSGNGVNEGEIYVNAYENIYLNTSSSYTTRMFISSSGFVGIGTTQPSSSLHVYGSFGNNPVTFEGIAGSANGWIKIKSGLTGSYQLGVAAGAFQIYDDLYSTKFYIASGSSSNVGIGTTTPNLSSGASGTSVLTISATTNARNALLELNGTRTNSTDITGYIRFFNNAAATPLADIRALRGSSDTSGELAFTTSDSERIRITSGGNVGIGITNPDYKLDITTSTQPIRIKGSSTGYTQGSLLFQSDTSSSPSSRGLGVYAFNEGTDATWFFGNGYNAADAFVINRKSGSTYQEAAAAPGESSNFLLINSSGNIGISTTSINSNVKLKVKATSEGSGISLSSATFVVARSATDTQLGIGYYTTPAAWVISSTYGSDGAYQPLAFATSDIERMRITSDGNLQFNTAGSGAAYIQVNQATSQDGGILWYRNNVIKWQNAITNPGDNMNWYSYTISSQAFAINTNGSATLYGALTQNASDRRLKNNIVNIPNALDKIKTLNGVTFNWENDIFKTERTNDIGVIAQEVKEILPEAVAIAPFDNDGEGNSKSGENYLTVYYEKLIPLLIEGIKELKAEFDEYKATHP